MRVKLSFIFLFLFVFLAAAYPQFDDFMKKAEKKVERKAEREADKAIDKTIDESTKGGKNEEINENIRTASEEKESLKSYSKFDFIPGNKILFYDDFSLDLFGDFPLKWSANGKGEVVGLNNIRGNWFKLHNNASYVPNIEIDNFSENFTIEFDLILDKDKKISSGSFSFDIYNIKDRRELPNSSGTHNPGVFVTITISPDEQTTYHIKDKIFKDKKVTNGYISNEIKDSSFIKGEKNRISISVNKSRYRLYVNEEKILDLPGIVPADVLMNSFAFRANGWNDKYPYEILVGNIKISEGAPDLKSQLITEGKFVTRGILFHSGSDKIKPQSYGTLKSIANVLNENSSINIKIIGHTDNEGDISFNMDLSKRRALAVKKALSNEFGINPDRLDIEGKGENEPVSDNSSPEGKAKNRRVEFIKL